jgi:Fe-Mn family superoxide dismutase
MSYKLPDLPYGFDALEPHIDAQTMEIHHGKHHAGYVAKLNAALEGSPKLLEKNVEGLLRDINSVPEKARTAVINNGGGHANHSLFWKVMSPNGGGQPAGVLAEAINSKFESFDQFKEQFTSTAAGHFGSGWGWLVVGKGGGLKIYSTPNQEGPYLRGDTPILAVDVWEHAYYLKYQNRRPDYLNAWWKVVNWREVDRRFSKAR